MLVNKDRAIGVMEHYGVDFVLGTTPENVTYLSDYASWQLWMYRGNISEKGRQSYALLPRDQGTAPALVVDVLPYLAQTDCWMEDFVYTYAPTPPINMPSGIGYPPEVT